MIRDWLKEHWPWVVAGLLLTMTVVEVMWR